MSTSCWQGISRRVRDPQPAQFHRLRRGRLGPVGRYAGERINNIALAMMAGLGLSCLARVIHAAPTQGEAVRQAAQACVRSLAAAAPATVPR
jgi:hypothetical protein